LFADTGLSGAQISSLFIIWSVVGFALEVPSGAWADTYSRKKLLTLAPLLRGAGFALWTFAPSYPSFAIGFVLWGASGALQSGTWEALVYEAAPSRYARLIGRSEAVSTIAVMAASALAAPVLAAGGYPALGVASVVAALLTTVVGLMLPESRGHRDEGDGYLQTLRAGFTAVRSAPQLRHRLLLVAAISGFDALDEYLPLLIQSTGVGAVTVPLLGLVISIGVVVGGWFAGTATRWTPPALALAAVSMAIGAASGHPAGIVLVAVAFGVFQWAIAAADARLQECIDDRARATVTSIAGFGIEVVAVLTFAGYAFGSQWTGPGPLFVVAAVPYLVVAVALRRVESIRSER
jgi:MFS family permease